jgi:hypothetical protein
MSPSKICSNNQENRQEETATKKEAPLQAARENFQE